MRKSLSLENRIARRIGRKSANVFLRDDFADLGDYDQVGRVLRKLATKGQLIRIGYGLYAKAKPSILTGELVPTVTLPKLGQEALARLKVKTVPSTAELAYRAGQSTQVPTGRLIGVRGRISRKIGYKGAYLQYEHLA